METRPGLYVTRIRRNNLSEIAFKNIFLKYPVIVYNSPLSMINAIFIIHFFFRALHVLLSLHLKLKGEHYELITHKIL